MNSFLFHFYLRVNVTTHATYLIYLIFYFPTPPSRMKCMHAEFPGVSTLSITRENKKPKLHARESNQIK